MKISERLRESIKDIRRRPYPISDLIPQLSEAADTLDSQALTLAYEIDICSQAIASREILDTFIRSLVETTTCDVTRDKINNFIKSQVNR